MEDKFWEPFLRRAELRVAFREDEIAEQLSHIVELERQGQDSRKARAWLVELEHLLIQHVAHRNYLRQKCTEEFG